MEDPSQEASVTHLIKRAAHTHPQKRTERKTERQTDRQTDRQDRQDRQDRRGFGCAGRVHAHTDTHTHAHTLSSECFTLGHTHTNTHKHTDSLSHTRTHTHTRTHRHAHTLLPTEAVDSGMCMDRRNATLCDAAAADASDLSAYLWVFIAGRVLHGVGAVPLYTVCVTFLDDCVSKETFSLYIGQSVHTHTCTHTHTPPSPST